MNYVLVHSFLWLIETIVAVVHTFVVVFIGKTGRFDGFFSGDFWPVES